MIKFEDDLILEFYRFSNVQDLRILKFLRIWESLQIKNLKKIPFTVYPIIQTGSAHFCKKTGKIRALFWQKDGQNWNFIFYFNFLKKSKLAKSWWAPTILWNKWFFFRENNHCTFCAIHRACTWFNCPKQHNNALNVHKITNRRAKSQKYGR